MSVDSTRLRFIEAGTAEDLSFAVSALPFKVELKQIVSNGKRWVAWFVIPDEVQDFNNVVLDG